MLFRSKFVQDAEENVTKDKRKQRMNLFLEIVYRLRKRYSTFVQRKRCRGTKEKEKLNREYYPNKKKAR